MLEAKACGYEQLMRACGERKDLAPALLIVEQLPQLVAEQVKAVQNLKIDKITVWDSGNGGNGQGSSTAGFLKGMIGALPPVHELARQVGIELPEYLGEIADTGAGRSDEIDPGPMPLAAKDPDAGDDKTV